MASKGEKPHEKQVNEADSAEQPDTEAVTEETIETVGEEVQSEKASDTNSKKTVADKVSSKGKKGNEEKLKAENQELKDKYLRQLAEFENFRVRTTKEKVQMYEVGAKEVLEKILPTIDNFERGIQFLTEEEKTSKFAEGMKKVYEGLMTALEEIGVKPIEAVGKEFDLNLHNAVMHEEDEAQDENMIVQELQKGYLYKDSVLRFSMVKVVN